MSEGAVGVGMAARGRPVFPFSALVGQETLRLALRLCAISPKLGGVLIRGHKGTAKSTAVRALAAVLPDIRSVVGCRYQCDPDRPEQLCDECRARLAAGETLAARTGRVALVELPVGATDDRVVGTLDLERAIREGARSFEPGLLARANRGILYADEVNLLNDHLVDLLLDAAAMGVNYVEREGISISHPAEFILIGTMNPEEGELRPQLLDRFALCVDIDGNLGPAERAEVVRRRIAFEADPAACLARWAAAERAESARLAAARAMLPRVRLDDALLELIGEIGAAMAVDGLRADIVTYRAACALAAWDGRTEVTVADVQAAAELALRHRRRRQPFDETGLDHDRLDDLIRQHAPPPSPPPPPLAAASSAAAPPQSVDGHEPPAGTADESPEVADAEPGEAAAGPEDASDAGSGEAEDGPAGAGDAGSGEAGGAAGERVFETPAPYPVQPPGDDRKRKWWLGGAGRGARVYDGDRGHRVGSAPWRAGAAGLALGATLRAAAPYQLGRRASHPDGPALRLEWSDLRRAVLEARAARLVLLVVDASGSMGARARMTAAKGAAISLLLDAYQRRNRVGLIACRGASAEVVLPPTNSVELAERQLRDLPTGGRTPLAHALTLAGDLLARAARAHPDAEPLLVLITDGRGNVGLAGADATTALQLAATRLRAAGPTTVVLDVEQGHTRLGLARRLSTQLAARWLPIHALAAESVRAAIDATARRQA